MKREEKEKRRGTRKGLLPPLFIRVHPCSSVAIPLSSLCLGVSVVSPLVTPECGPTSPCDKQSAERASCGRSPAAHSSSLPPASFDSETRANLGPRHCRRSSSHLSGAACRLPGSAAA